MAVNEDFLAVNLNNDFKEVFKSESNSSLNENIETSLALGAFIEKRVTLARAAELAGKDLSEFIKILSKYDIPWMEYTEETFKEDQETLEDLRGITND
jgi:predicted HTH domain antitoxin